MGKLFRIEYEGRVHYIDITPRWKPPVEQDAINLRFLLCLDWGVTVGVRLFGSNLKTICRHWYRGEYDMFCANDYGESLTQYPQVMQVVDYVLQRTNSLERYAKIQAPCFEYVNGVIQLNQRTIYLVEGKNLTEFAIKQMSSGTPPDWGKCGVEAKCWGLEPWETLNTTIDYVPRARVKNTATQTHELVDVPVPPRKIPFSATRIK